jgi:hypothetical protein
MNKNVCFKLFACTIMATIAALTTHIYVMKWMQPYIDMLVQGMDMNPAPSTYSWLIIGSAYATAFMMIGVYTLLYYHLQHVVPGTSKLSKCLWVTLIIFAVKSEYLVRQPIMNFILSYESMSFLSALAFVVLDHIDKWLANILLAFCLVYFCPKKVNQ